MLRDTSISENLCTILDAEELSKRFESVVSDVMLRKTKKKDLMTVSRDERGHFSAQSALAPTGSCSQEVLENAFKQFVYNLTGETQSGIIDIAMKDPDHKKEEQYYDKLESVFDTVRGDTVLGVTILADDRGIISATWSLQGREKRIFPKLSTIFSRHKVINQIP